MQTTLCFQLKVGMVTQKGPQLGTERVDGYRLLLHVNWYPKSWHIKPYHVGLNDQEKDKQRGQRKSGWCSQRRRA